MKRIIFIIISIFILCSCSQRSDYYVFSFDDYSLAIGYDDVEYLQLVFDLDAKQELEPKEVLNDVEVRFFDEHFAYMDLSNYKNRKIKLDKAKITKANFYVDNIAMHSYKIDDIELSNSVAQNCKLFDGQLIERNGYACIFGKKAGDKNNIVILRGDLFKINQDELSRIEIYVE